MPPFCLNFRHGANETYRWEFDKGKQSLAVAVDGPLIVDDVQLLIRAANDGVGLSFLMEQQAAPYLTNGQLVRVVDGVNYARLARIKAQYDPANLFRENPNILPSARSDR